VVDEVLGIMAAAPPLPSKAAQVKQELIVTRLAHRLGLRQETVWARLGELRRERHQKEQQSAAKTAATMPAAARTTHPAGAPPKGKAGPTVAAEMQFLELLLAHPLFVGKAVAAVTPEQITHPDAKRVLVEMYAVHAVGMTPDMDALRERLQDRPDLFEAAERRRFVGQHMQEPEEWLNRILRRFAELRAEAEQRAVKEQLASASADEAVELLRKLQQTGGKKKNAG
jgi:DNA primase